MNWITQPSNTSMIHTECQAPEELLRCRAPAPMPESIDLLRDSGKNLLLK